MVQPKTFGQRELLRQARRAAKRGDAPQEVPQYWRPRYRSECRDGPRPCPYVACKFNLFLDITPRGGLRIPFGEEPEDLDKLTESCALDIAERGPVTLEYVASVQAITRERVRQIELSAIARMQEALAVVMKDDEQLGEKAHHILARADREKKQVGDNIDRLRDRSRRAKKSVIDWLDEVGPLKPEKP